MRRVLLFAKRPRRGKVKTRLVPPLTAEQALTLYFAFLEDQLRWLNDSVAPESAELCLDGPFRPPPRLVRLLGRIPRTTQGPGDLGERMLRAFRRCHSEACTATLIVAADAPTLPGRLLESAFAAIEAGADGALAPSVDGGYVLIGLRRPRPELFSRIDWGTPTVLAQTRARARAAGIELALLPPWYDVDDRHSLAVLRRELRRPAAARRAPSTRRVLDRIEFR